jgi:hypothetical protein
MGDPHRYRRVVAVEQDEAVLRPLPKAVGVGALAGVAGFSFGLVLVALPLFGLARALETGNGLQRPFIRDNLTLLVLPVALVMAVLCGVVVGRWYRRGGRLP